MIIPWQGQMVISPTNIEDKRILRGLAFMDAIFCLLGSVTIKVNDDICHYFQTKEGIRQGNPLSPILFNIVVDMLAVLIERAKEDEQIEGVVPHLVEGGLSIIQYAYDTILFMDHDTEKAKNLKLILSTFE
jgi:hypothetical protein